MAETKDKIVSLEVLKDTRDSLKSEIDGKVAKEEGKGLSTNDFTDEYKNKVDSALDNYVESDPTVPAWAKEAKKPTYTPEEVGAEASGTVSAHNVATDAHKDIRELISGLRDGKVNISDVIDNLVTNETNKPLSAAQGVALKALIDGLSSEKLDASALARAIDEALAQAKASGDFKGEDGENGISATHSWDGTVLTITSSSGMSSADLKGDKGDAPIKGVDYFTEADKDELVERILAEMPDYDGTVEVS